MPIGPAEEETAGSNGRVETFAGLPEGGERIVFWLRGGNSREGAAGKCCERAEAPRNIFCNGGARRGGDLEKLGVARRVLVRDRGAARGPRRKFFLKHFGNTKSRGNS